MNKLYIIGGRGFIAILPKFYKTSLSLQAK